MRLIDADVVYQAIIKWAGDEDVTAIASGACKAADIVRSAPTVCANPSKQGKWLFRDHLEFDVTTCQDLIYPDEEAHCSECGYHVWIRKIPRPNYCPRCGTRNEVIA